MSEYSKYITLRKRPNRADKYEVHVYNPRLKRTVYVSIHKTFGEALISRDMYLNTMNKKNSNIVKRPNIFQRLRSYFKNLWKYN